MNLVAITVNPPPTVEMRPEMSAAPASLLSNSLIHYCLSTIVSNSLFNYVDAAAGVAQMPNEIVLQFKKGVALIETTPPPTPSPTPAPTTMKGSATTVIFAWGGLFFLV
jgi:hypothetical protein